MLLARVIQDSAIWRDDPHVLKLFVYLIMEARFDSKPKKYHGFEVNRGEVLTSLHRISEDNEYFKNTVKTWSRAKVSRMLSKLEEQGYIDKLSDTYGTHISIRNYETYQQPSLYVSDSDETVVKHPCNGSETVVKTSKKGKEGTIKVKKDKEIRHKHGEYKHVLLTEKQIVKLNSDFGIQEKDEMIKNLDEYIETSGKSYKNHNLTMRNWKKRDAEKMQTQSKGDLIKERYRLALLKDQKDAEK